MLVKDMIEAIKSNDLKIKDLAEMYGCSDRTIQTKIKNLGFEWVAKEARYDFVGNDENVFTLPIDEVFKSKAPIRRNVNNTSNNDSKSTAKSEVKSASEQVAITTPETNSKTTSKINSNKTSNKAVTNKSNSAIYNASNKTSDNIDRLLAGKKAKKAYRGFYFDSDVLAIIDNVDNGVKSELINECLRKVFKEKGLL